MKFTKFYKTIKAIAYLGVVASVIDKTTYRCVSAWSLSFIKQFESRLIVNGAYWTMSRYKSIYNLTKQKLMNHNLEQDPFISTTKCGWPKEVYPIKDYINLENLFVVRLVLTVLRIYESVKLKETFEPESIVSEYSGKPLYPIIKDFSKFVKLWITKFKPNWFKLCKISNLLPELSFRLKAGPNGPSILTAHLDAISLYKNKELWNVIATLAKKLEAFGIFNTMNSIKDSCKQFDFNKSKDLLLGRISLASEPAGKTRLFAIGNFWIQSLLKPLHNRLMSILKGLKMDGTYDQMKQFNRATKLSCNLASWSYDLSKATDRFPLLILQEVMQHLFSKEISVLWYKLMILIPYSYGNKSYHWRVGQPLGLFTSWAIFALTHHLTVQYCAYKAYGKLIYFKDYSLLGDDIVIWNRKVAQMYLHFMNDIGVAINLTKSVTGSKKDNRIEFAKRVAYQGQNISGLGFPLIEASYKYGVLSGWNRLLEILENEDFINIEGHLVFPDVEWYDLPIGELTPQHRQFIWFHTCKMALAQKLFIADGDGNILSHDDVMEQFVLEQLVGTNNQIKSLPKRHQLDKVINRIKKISKRFGVQVSTDLFGAKWIESNSMTLAHPIILYLDLIGSKYFTKVEEFHIVINAKLWTQSSTVLLNNWSKDLVIPSLKLDVFYNEGRHENIKLTVKTIIRSFNKLMRLINKTE